MLPDVINGQAQCLYVRYASICWGVSLKQHVTCVTISNKGNVV